MSNQDKMDKTKQSLALVLLGTALFNYLFWEETEGLNVLVFSVFWVTSLAWLFPESRRNLAFWASGGGLLVAAGMVVWHHSVAADFAFYIALACSAGFAQVRELRFVLHAAGQYFFSLFYPVKKFRESLPSTGGGFWAGFAKLRRRAGVGCLPLVVAFVFYCLYYFANEHIAALADRFWAEFWRIFSFDFSIAHALFVLLGFFVVGAALWYTRTAAVPENAEPDFLERRPKSDKNYQSQWPLLGLAREHRQSVFLLVLLNLMLFVVNWTDIQHVWFAFDEAARADLKGYVHEGTYVLIASILLAMGVLFYVFRGNLNFFSRNQFLKKAALVWLVQNCILAVSVAVRTGRYIEFHGLAYKRIGVLLFLALVFFGLFTLGKKIVERRSFFWLWVQNGWAVFALLIANACVPWDTFITQYNLFGPVRGSIDVQFLLHTVSDKNLRLLENNVELLKQKETYPALGPNEVEQAIGRKRWAVNDRLLFRKTWKSWNAADEANR